MGTSFQADPTILSLHFLLKSPFYVSLVPCSDICLKICIFNTIPIYSVMILVYMVVQSTNLNQIFVPSIKNNCVICGVLEVLLEILRWRKKKNIKEINFA